MYSSTSHLVNLCLSAHLLFPLKLHTTTGKRCGTSSHLWPDEWPETFQEGLDLYVMDM